SGDAAAAAVQAHLARVAFTRQRRPGWASWARYLEHAARFEAGERTVRLLRDLLRNCAQLEQGGWLVTPQESKQLAGRTALALGRHTEAVQLLSEVALARKGGGPAKLRILAWEAEVALREASGDATGAGRAVDSGLRVVSEYAGTFGATDLRTGATQLGASL